MLAWLMAGLTVMGAVSTSDPARAAAAAQAPSALRAGDWAVLDRQFSAIQAAYESGRLDDEQLRAEFRVFYDTDRSLAARYDAWLAHSPKSYVAHLAKGIFYKRVGIEDRGTASARETSPEKFVAMRRALEIAGREFSISETLTPRPLLTYLHVMDVTSYLGDAELTRAFLDKALRLDPKSFIVREKYMGTLQRKWGGSPEQMQDFLAESRRAGLSASDMSQLQAVIQLDQAWAAQFVEKNP
jgi:hypothetical protein